ncbi:MAG: asparagine synthase-related protein [Isosphaeraceae bacterium]|nr:asparagine synthase-related protein [Isosphaeraceae bacterium]
MGRPRPLDVLPTLVRHYGEPFADSSAIPSYYVAQMTRQHVTVALNGDGGDESFAGYERYWATGLAEKYGKLPRVLRRRVLEPLAALVPDSLPRRSRLGRGKRFLQAASQPASQRYLRWVTYFSPEQKGELYTSDFRAELRGHEGQRWLLDEFETLGRGGLKGLDAILAADVRSYLPYDLLVKMDIATMASSLEARSPFLDHKLMEFSARLPYNFKIRGGVLKYGLKKVAQDFLPTEILNRRKMGFGVPVGEWLRGELRPLLEDALLSSESRLGQWLRHDSVRELVQAHVAGASDHTYRIWSLLWLELWLREFVS